MKKEKEREKVPTFLSEGKMSKKKIRKNRLPLLLLQNCAQNFGMTAKVVHISFSANARSILLFCNCNKRLAE